MNKKRIITIILILIWMTTIFFFSSQVSEESDETSGKTARIIINILPGTKGLDEKQKADIAEIIDPTIRKLAHYSIYAIGGFLFICLMNTYEISTNKRILYSQLAGTIYAITDEIHQYFTFGRSAQLQDIAIDSIGIATGIVVGLIIYTSIIIYKTTLVNKVKYE